ncbi:MAG: pseudaminic acid synthase [Gemmatimonadales bacterium]
MSLRIGNVPVGPGSPAFLVAELSANHGGSLSRALETVHAAKEAGADAIKLQTYTADTLTLRSDRPEFTILGGPWAGRTLHDLYTEAHTPWDWHERLFLEARSVNLPMFSTPFDPTAVALLESLDAPAHKVASFELVDDGLLRQVAATGKPVILSTGMASREEIDHAVAVLRDGGTRDLILLRCTSSYPAPDDAMHLRTLPMLAAAYGVPVGLSDHSMGTTAAVVAVAFGACLIEKHFTLSRADGGPDGHFSLEPAEFATLVHEVRRAEAMLGEIRFGAGTAEEGSVQFRRSLYAVADIRAGEVFTSSNIRSIRPGHGLPPRDLDTLLGRRAPRDIARATPLTPDLLSHA